MTFGHVDFRKSARNVTAQHRNDNVLGVEVTCIVKRDTKSACFDEEMMLDIGGHKCIGISVDGIKNEIRARTRAYCNGGDIVVTRNKLNRTT